MTSQQDRTDNRWQWFFTLAFGLVISMQGYNIDQLNKANERQNLYIERIKSVEMKQDYTNDVDFKQTEILNNHEQRIETHEQRIEKIEAILIRNKYNITR